MRSNLIVPCVLFLALTGICLGSVLIKEVELNPLGDERNRDSPQWVNLYNSGTEDVDMSGWRLVTTDETTVFPDGTILSAYGTHKVTEEFGWLRTENESISIIASNGTLMDKTPILSDTARNEYVWSRIGVNRANTIQDWSYQAASYN